MARRPNKSAAPKAVDGKAMPGDKTKTTSAKTTSKTDTAEVHAEAMKRWGYAYERERENIDDAYSDLRFRLGDQWDRAALAARAADARPVLTFNRIPQFVKQITGDIRQMRPAVKVVGVDDRADRGVADLLSGMIRYIENRSDANKLYFSAADSQVTCGIGHWRVVSEYASDTTFDQELGVELIEDGVAVLWDPDAVHPTRKDAKYCFVPVDLSREEFKRRYPDATADAMPHVGGVNVDATWSSDDHVRIAEYWVKEKTKRKLALRGDGGVDDLTDDTDAAEKEARILAEGGRVEMRDGFRVRQYVISATEVLEGPKEWAGRYIPIIPVIGEEVRVGRRRYRHGVVRFAKDAQRAYNYFRSTETEVVALQPKAPWIGTVDMFKDSENEWATANQKNYPYLTYRPDPKAPQARPERSSPAVSTAGLTEGAMQAAEDMKAVIGIYDASLGAKSNETSGRAITARQREGDTGAYVYVDNFSLAVQHTGRVLVDLIPHVYDTPRTIRVVGEDGKVDVAKINQPAGLEVDGASEKIENDVTIGAYDVSLEMGPSYTTKREEARQGMLDLLQTAPTVAPLIMDLVAKAQDWPLADKIAKRLQSTLPPQIAMQEAAESGEPPPPPPPPPPPDPRAEAEVAKSQAEVELKQIDLEIKKLQLMVEEAKAATAMQGVASGDELAQKLAMLEQAMMFMQEHMTGGFDEPQEPQDGGEGLPMMPHSEMGETPAMEAMEPPETQMAEGPNETPQQPPPGGFFMPGDEQ